MTTTTTHSRPRPPARQASRPDGRPLPEHRCPCGADHPVTLAADTDIRVDGPTMAVLTPYGTWRVPRVWIAVHSLLPIAKTVAAARQYGWEPVDPW